MNLLDYDRVSERRTILNQIQNPAERDAIHGNNILQPMLDSGLGQLCLLPPETHVHNLVEYGMARRYGPRWVEWFYKRGGCCEFAVEPIGTPTFLTKTGHGNNGGYGLPVHFSWKYAKRV